MEGAAHNLPDRAALCAASDILTLCREAGEGEVVVAVISGGGSALLPCPVQGVELEEKRKVCVILLSVSMRTFQMYGIDGAGPAPSLYTKYYCAW